MLLWLAEHWWLFVAVGMIIVACLAASGIESVAKIVSAGLKVLQSTAEFFVEPANQRAPKALAIIVAFCIGAWLANVYTHHEDVAAEQQRNASAAAQTAAAIAAADARAAQQAAAVDKQATAESEAADRANAEERTAYVADLEKQASVCRPASADAVKRLRRIR